jgi:hypothetical protein
MKLHFIVNSSTPFNINGVWQQKRDVVTLGDFKPLDKSDLIKYVKKYPNHWIEL